MKYTYLLLLFFTLLFPLLFSFEKKMIAYYRNFSSLFTSIVLVALFFAIWDEFFTQMGVWSFNTDYVSGIFLLSLPLEEWLFFIVIPYSCVFIYEALKFFFRKNSFPSRIPLAYAYILSALLGLIGIISYDKIYTFVTCILTSAFIILHIRLLDNRYWGSFLLAYFIHLIPFFIVNGFLTALPVVSYNNSENLAVRIATIPVEDTIYSMLLLLMNVTFFEFFKEKIFTKNTKSVLNHG